MQVCEPYELTHPTLSFIDWPHDLGFIVSIRYSIIVLSHDMTNPGFRGKKDVMQMAENSERQTQ